MSDQRWVERWVPREEGRGNQASGIGRETGRQERQERQQMHHHCIALLRTVRCATASPRAIVTCFLPSTPPRESDS
jgi:hypothetical protein